MSRDRGARPSEANEAAAATRTIDGDPAHIRSERPARRVTPRGALRRSLVLWGWGHLALGYRFGGVLAAVEIGALLAFLVLTPRLIDGTLSVLLFLAGVAFLMAWVSVAVDAYRRAGRAAHADGVQGPGRKAGGGDAARHERDAGDRGVAATAGDRGAAATAGDGSAAATAGDKAGRADVGDGGAVELLWLAPIVIVVSSAFWGLGGNLASPQSALATYVRDWRSNEVASGSRLFAAAPTDADLGAAWSRQLARLHNALVPLVATSGTDSGIDPSAPLDSVRFLLDDPVPGAEDRRVVHVQIVRRETVRDSFFGLVPTTTQRLAPVADLGTVTLALVPSTGAPGGTWRIGSLAVLGERIGN